MSIQFGDILRHNNPNYPIVDVTDIKGGLRSITTFGSASLISEYTSGASGSIIPEKYKSGYSLLLETSTGNIYYFTGIDPTNVDHWSSIGITGTGSTNTIPKWISPSILGNSSITDDGDTVVISSNLMVIGTTSTVNTENLLVKDAIILLAGSQYGSPMFDAGLFINRGTSDTQAFIWDESMDEFKFITTTSGATVSGDVSIGTYSSVRTGVLSVGTGTQSNSRFIVSSSGGTVSLVVDEFGNVYNVLKGITNTLFGYQSGLTTTSGLNNTSFGYQSLYVNESGGQNTGLGASSLLKNTTGSFNIGVGASSLLNNTIGNYNTGIGYQSMYSNTIGANNTAVGYQSMYSSTSVISTLESESLVGGSGYIPGTYSNIQLIYLSGSTAITYPSVNIFVGLDGTVSTVTLVTRGSGFKNNTTIMGASFSTGSDFSVQVGTLSTGTNNTAIGHRSLYFNTIGDDNTAIGIESLYFNTTGTNNTAIGLSSLRSNTTGANNTAIGHQSLLANTTGGNNTAIGLSSLLANTTGGNNTTLGYQSLRSNILGSENIAIGNYTLQNQAVAQLGSVINPGTGYQDGYYQNVTLVYATGSNFLTAPIVDISISSGQVTVYDIISGGTGFIDTTTIFTINSYGTGDNEYSIGSGFEIGISQLLNGSSNTAIGYESLYSNTTGSSNTAIGANTLFYNTIGSQNVALGRYSLYYNTTGQQNTAIGNSTLFYNTSGYWNTAIGYASLNHNTTGYENTAIGWFSLYNNRTGDNNIAIGYQTLHSTTQSSDNIAIGRSSLYLNETGDSNTAIGYASLRNNKTGSKNIAIGEYSLYLNDSGNDNVAIGRRSLNLNETGYGGIAIGAQSLEYNTTADRNTAIGNSTLRYNRGFRNTAVGGYALQNASQAINTLSSTFSSGTGYTPGTYSNVRLIYSNYGGFWSAPTNQEWEYPTAEIVVGPGGTVSSVTLKQRGVLITDTTTRFTAQYGTYSYNLGTGSGTGFEIGIGTIGTASLNNAIGHGALYKLGIGSDNIGIGMWAGSLIGPTGSDGDLTGAEQSIFIGRFTSALNNNCINEIVIGNEAHGNGSNTVTLGNDNVIKTYLKGFIQLPTGPTTSTGTYSILTRNDITGEIEKITPSGYIINWYSENTTAPTTTPVASGSGSIAIGNNAKALSSNMFVYGESAGLDATGSDSSNFIGYYAGFQTHTSLNTNAIGNYAGFQSSNSGSSNFIGDYAGFQSSGSIKSNFIGDRAGLQSPGSEYSNFIGGHAGVQSPNTAYSNFFGRDAGHGAVGASYSNFFGRGAGQVVSAGQPGAYHSNFFGDLSGHNAYNSNNSNFFGRNAGSFAYNTNNSTFIGERAGHYSSGASHSNFFGLDAGAAGQVTYSNAHNSNFFGNSAGFEARFANNSNFLGERAGKGAYNGNNSNFLGQGSGQVADPYAYIDYNGIYYSYSSYPGGNNSNFIGANSGLNSGSNNSNFFGQNAGEWTFLAHNSNFFGFYAGAGANNAEYSNFIGNAAGQNALGAYKSNFIGHYAGAGATAANNSNFIGENAGLNSSGNNVNAFGVDAGVNNLLSGMTIFSNSSLPSYLDRAAATASISVINGGSIGSTYLYYNETTFTIEAVRLDNY